jgi:Protein of unknown function (DUF2950)
MKMSRRMKVPFHAFTLAVAGAIICSGCAKEEAGQTSSSFASPGAAAQEFAEAVRTGDKGRLAALLGPESAPLLNPGDTVQGGTERKAFVQAYDSVRLLVPAGPDAFFLEVGSGRWPLPLPIVKEGSEWKFDTRTGIRELVLRRIGRNELAVLGVMRGIVGAQHDYAAKKGAFASRLRSEPGKQDGLYWETSAGEPESPAGPLLAWAEAQGYTPGGAQPAPYRGYLYRRLNVANPKKEFAILAYPAEYGASGIMTFIVNQDGAIYRKNFGVETDKAAQEIQAFAPDETWTRES